MGPKLKTEHAGAKNGGGSYGKREDVKRESRRTRRARAREEIARQLSADGAESTAGAEGNPGEADADKPEAP